MPAPDPRANPDLNGHDAAEATLLSAITSARMHHAWLITGPEGIGKATLAYRFARRLLAGRPTEPSLALDSAHPVFRRVATGSHADLLSIERTINERTKRLRTQIPVEDVRRVGAFLSLTPAEGGWRVVIVDGAEDLNAAAANALLKTLEEPPPRAVLVLTCAAPGRLPATIRSRCRRLRLDALDDATMRFLLARYLPDMPADDRDRLVTLGEGSPGRALLMAEEEGLKIAGLVDQVLTAMPAIPPHLPHAIADALGRSDTGFATFMDLLTAGIAASVRDAARGHADPDQERLAGLRPLAEWGEIWNQLGHLRDETERFALDKRQAIVAGLSLLAGRP